jgi:hypothetical protein
MRKIVILAILAFGVINFGCDKSDKDTDEYYVKYGAGAQTIYSSMDLDITFINENETLTTTITSWSMTIGWKKRTP